MKNHKTLIEKKLRFHKIYYEKSLEIKKFFFFFFLDETWKETWNFQIFKTKHNLQFSVLPSTRNGSKQQLCLHREQRAQSERESKGSSLDFHCRRERDPILIVPNGASKQNQNVLFPFLFWFLRIASTTHHHHHPTGPGCSLGTLGKRPGTLAMGMAPVSSKL